MTDSSQPPGIKELVATMLDNPSVVATASYECGVMIQVHYRLEVTDNPNDPPKVIFGFLNYVYNPTLDCVAQFDKAERQTLTVLRRALTQVDAPKVIQSILGVSPEVDAPRAPPHRVGSVHRGRESCARTA